MQRANATAISHLVTGETAVLRKLMQVDLIEWREHISDFVYPLKQVHDTGHSIVLTVLIDFWQRLIDMAEHRGAAELASALSSAEWRWAREDRVETICHWCSHDLALIVGNAYEKSGPPVPFAVVTYIQEHLAERLTASTVAAHFDVSTTTLRAAIRAQCGTTLHGLIKAARLEAARDRIIKGEKIDGVMLEVGWRNRTTFFREFRLLYCVLPGELNRSGRRRISPDALRSDKGRLPK